MTSGTMHNTGHPMPGAARLCTCAGHPAYAGKPAPIHARKWLARFAIEAVSPVFATDHAVPRPLERSP